MWHPWLAGKIHRMEVQNWTIWTWSWCENPRWIGDFPARHVWLRNGIRLPNCPQLFFFWNGWESSKFHQNGWDFLTWGSITKVTKKNPAIAWPMWQTGSWLHRFPGHLLPGGQSWCRQRRQCLAWSGSRTWPDVIWGVPQRGYLSWQTH